MVRIRILGRGLLLNYYQHDFDYELYLELLIRRWASLN